MMKTEHNKRIFNMYFRDLFQWLIIMFAVCAVAFCAAVFFNGWNMWNYLILLIWCLIALSSVRFIIFCLGVYREISQNQISEKRITIHAIHPNNAHTFRSKGNGIVGDWKMLIEDTEGAIYRISLSKKAPVWERDAMLDRVFDITYLPDSQFLLSLAPCVDAHSRADQQFLKTVHALFGVYIENIDMVDLSQAMPPKK